MLSPKPNEEEGFSSKSFRYTEKWGKIWAEGTDARGAKSKKTK